MPVIGSDGYSRPSTWHPPAARLFTVSRSAGDSPRSAARRLPTANGVDGWHSTGEMGGVITPPLKLLDGVWFGIDGQWVGQATKFTSGWGYTRFDFPDVSGLHVQRTDFAPDAHRAVLFGLKLTNPGRARKTVTVMVDAHSELMTAYPWGFAGVTPNASDNIPDHGSFTNNELQFTDDGALPGAPEHHYAALVKAAGGAATSGTAADTGGNFRGPQPGHACTGSEATLLRAPATTDRSARARAASCSTAWLCRGMARRRSG